MSGKDRLKKWEIALLLGVALAALAGAWLGSIQTGLADRVVRLHVVANSDSPADQAVKLEVRDAVLEKAAPLLEGMDRAGALCALEKALPQLGEIAAETLQQAGFDYPVRASLEECWFPTREYGDFSLPAGSYTALRVELGEGKGKNWWCVVFPPLCLGSAGEKVAETALEGGLSQDQVSLMTGESQGYVIKFKAVELWERFKARR